MAAHHSITRIVRTRRRSIGLKITDDAELIIHAPRWVPVWMIEKIVREKAKWIERTRQRIANRPKPETKRFVTGEQFLFRGESYPLSVVPDLQQSITFDRGFFAAKGGTHARDAMEKWYAKEAHRIIAARVTELSEQHRIPCRCFHLSRGTSRWGSCSGTNAVRISWRLIMAPPAVLDYVICHELAHVRQKNHSAKFWMIVETMSPDHKEQRMWLRKNGHLLSL